MILQGIKELYTSMKQQSIDRYKFNYKNGKGEFDIFFFIDETPFILLFGAIGTNISFEVKVNKGFKINTFLDQKTLNDLKKVLKIKGGGIEKFSTNKFFEHFNQNIPKTAHTRNIPKPKTIIKYKKNIEEADKVYFIGWRDNTKRGDQVSQENLKKTKELLGKKAYKICKEKNTSSCWTDNPTKEIKFYIP